MLNIDRLIEAIRSEELAKFDMCEWRLNNSVCGTVACIGGTAELLQEPHPHGGFYEEQEIADWITKGTPAEDENSARIAVMLFYASDEHGNEYSLDGITAKDAIKTLETLRDTGKVVWHLD